MNKTTKKVKDEMKEIRKKTKNILISGGEPTIRPDILDIVSYAKSLGFTNIAIETNGRMLSYIDFCNDIVKCGVNEFFVYINGPNAKVHENITQIKGSFEETLTSINNLREMCQSVEAKVFVLKENYKYLLEIFASLSKLRANSVIFLISRMPEKAGMLPKYAEIAKEMKKVYDYAKRKNCNTSPIPLFV
jgi:MoaA/NifB/PqqE/SkfB family radical SAM enzyme